MSGHGLGRVSLVEPLEPRLLLSVTADAAEPNNSFLDAHELGPISGLQTTSSLTIDSSSDRDWFRFETSQPGQSDSYVRIDFNQTRGDLDLELYDSTGRFLQGSWGTTNSEQISLNRYAAGTYYAMVSGKQGATSDNYSLTVNAMALTSDWAEPNDTLAAPLDLGDIVGYRVFSGLSIHALGNDDYFRFRMTSAGTAGDYVTIDFLNSGGDLDMRLYDANGTQVGSSGSTANQEKISLAGLAAGTYVARIYGYHGNYTNDNYKLSIHAPGAPAGDANETNDTFATATNLGQVTGLRTWQDLSIHAAGDTDWFRFTIDQPAILGHYARISFANNRGNLDLKLYSSQGQLLSTSATTSDTETVSLASMEAGMYYLQIAGVGGDTNPSYSLALSTPLSADGDWAEPNETFAGAYDLGIASGVRTWSGLSIHAAGDIDVFRFQTASLGTSADSVRIDFTGGTGDLNLTLHDAGGTILATSAGTGDLERISLANLAAGTYYVGIRGAGSAVNAYTLTIAAPGGLADDWAEDNDSLADAHDLGSVAGHRSWTGLNINTLTDEDWFRLTIQDTCLARNYVQILFTHSSGDLDMRLYDAGGALRSVSQGVVNNERLSLEGLTAGSYYIEVFGYDGGVNTYALEIDAPQTGLVAPDAYESREPLVLLENQTLDSLTIHDPGDWGGVGTADDTFRFTTSGAGNSSNYVQIDFTRADGDLSLYLYSSGNQLVGSSQTGQNYERISLASLSAGTYTIVVRGVSGATNHYNLTLAAPFLSSPADWTVMVYLAADNNLEYYAIGDLNEMESVTLPGSLKLGVLLDRWNGYDSGYYLGYYDDTTNGNWTDTRVGAVTHDTDTARIGSTLTSWGERNTAQAATLSDFLTWGMSALPARNYALIIWDHGGATYGAAEDSGSGNDMLSLSEIATALAEAPDRVDVLGFDACLMATAEVVHAVSPYVDYLVSSEETEGGDGWDYVTLLNNLASHLPLTPAQWAQQAVASAAGNSAIKTMSAVTASASTLTEAMASFVLAAENLGTSADWSALRTARNTAPGFDYAYFRDLGTFLREASLHVTIPALAAAATTALAALNASVVSNYSVWSSGGTGLSIYLPAYGEDVYSGYGSLSFPAATRWDEFLGVLNGTGSFSSGVPASDWAESNNTRAMATNLKEVTGTATFAGLSIHSATDVDWYRFTMVSSGTAGSFVGISFSQGNLDLYLYGADGALVASSATDGGTESISMSARAEGQYFLKVVGRSGAITADYSIVMTSMPVAVPDWAEDNDTRSAAVTLTLGSAATGLNLLPTDEDWFRLPAQTASPRKSLRVTLQCNLSRGTAQLELYNAGGELLATSSPTVEGAILEYSVPTQDVFVRVTGLPSGAVLPYTLTPDLVAPSGDDAMRPLFSETFYLHNNSDVATAVTAGAFASGFAHYLAYGAHEGRNPSAYFDEAYYLAHNPDVAAQVTAGTYRSGFEQFARLGIDQHRQPSPFFDETYYLQLNTDVNSALQAGTLLTAYEHFVFYGVYEGRSGSSLFDERFYLAHNADVAAAVYAGAFSNGLDHFLAFGAREGRNSTTDFNSRYYLSAYSDVRQAVQAGAFSSAFQHYLLFGRNEGRSGQPPFMENVYLILYPEISAAVAAGAFASAYDHYSRFGKAEGRTCWVEFNEQAYLARYADVAAAVLGGAFSSGLQHYLLFGQYEHRNPLT